MFTRTSDAIQKKKKKKENQKKLCCDNLFTLIVLFPICFKYRKRVCNLKLAFGVVEVFMVFKYEFKDHNRVFFRKLYYNRNNFKEKKEKNKKSQELNRIY